MTRPYRIFVVSPSLGGARRLAEVLVTDPMLTVIGTSLLLEDAFKVLASNPPDCLILSERFRGSQERDDLIILMQERDVRWVELSARNGPQTPEKALPPRSGLFEIDRHTPAPVLIQHIRSVCRNIRRPGTSRSSNLGTPPNRHPFSQKLVLIGSSTGGVECLINILASYSPNSPPTLIVQHTGRDFIASLIELLNKRCPVPVVPAIDGFVPRQGVVGVAYRSEAHLTLAEHAGTLRCRNLATDAVSGHRPSVDALFQSAVPLAKQIVAVILTGMGQDGAAGMAALRRGGAITLAQDKETSIVYGMPRVAVELGGVDHILPIDDIAQVLAGGQSLPQRGAA